MKYALNLGEDGRILSVTYEHFAAEGMPVVDELLEGNVGDYRYVNGEFIYDSLPETEKPTQEGDPSLEDRVRFLEADSADMKEALEMILNGVTE